MLSTRRRFCSQAATFLAAPVLLTEEIPAQQPTASTSTQSSGSAVRPNVTVIDHDRIITAADSSLTQPATPITTLAAEHSPGTPRDFYSGSDFTAHSGALFTLGHIVPTLVAAFVITKDERYAKQATAHLEAWFVSPKTSLTPSLELAQYNEEKKSGRPEGLVEGLPLVEIAQSIPFLSFSESLSESSLATISKWFIAYLDWLNNSRSAGLARDARNHDGSSWMLQAAACAKLNVKDDRPLTALRHQFRASLLRAQINYEGNFLRELSTPDPFRNSLFNLDLLAGAADLLSTRFESVWDYELQDGPGMRVAIARHFPFIANRGTWPYRADSAFFNELPLRRPALLFAARAYSRPEYADLWRKLPADTKNPTLDRTFPIRQPILWVTRPRP